MARIPQSATGAVGGRWAEAKAEVELFCVDEWQPVDLVRLASRIKQFQS